MVKMENKNRKGMWKMFYDSDNQVWRVMPANWTKEDGGWLSPTLPYSNLL